MDKVNEEWTKLMESIHKMKDMMDEMVIVEMEDLKMELEQMLKTAEKLEEMMKMDMPSSATQ